MRAAELLEGIHDPNRFKAIFMIGGPGSGKTFVARKIAGGTGLKIVNVDDVYEWMRERQSVVAAGFDPEIYQYSWSLTQKRLNNYLEGGLGLVIDATGRNPSNLLAQKAALEDLGYETMAVYVHTDVLTALDRNEQRRRMVDPKLVRQFHQEVAQAIGPLKGKFDKFVMIDNRDEEAFAQSWSANQSTINAFLREAIREDDESDEDEEERERQLRHDLSDLATYIVSACQPYLKEVGISGLEHPLWRGVRPSDIPHDDQFWFRGVTRTDRKPVDTAPDVHGIYNFIIEKKGLVANRSNSLFTTGNISRAGNYGIAHAIVPIGAFNYTWSAEFVDWFSDPTLIDARRAAKTYDDKKELLDKRISPTLRGDDGSLYRASQTRNEIMVHCPNGYLAIHRQHYQMLAYYIEHKLTRS